MKRLELSEHERRTLRDMGVFHQHPRTRMRAQGILRLSEGLILQKTPDEFGVQLNSVEQWCQRWGKLGLFGLYGGRHTGRPRKWTPSSNRLLANWRKQKAVPWSHCCVRSSKAETMRQSARTRPSGISWRWISATSAIDTVKKKRNQEAFEPASNVIGALAGFDQEQECELLYSTNPVSPRIPRCSTAGAGSVRRGQSNR